jgi:hypothetical protein
MSLSTKRQYIEGFFRDLENKAMFLNRLFDEKHKAEARLLCCCYIEAFGNGLAGNPSSEYMKQFCTVLMGHGSEPVFSLIHLRLLQSSVPYKNISKKIQIPLRHALNMLPADQVFTAEEISDAIRESVPSEAVQILTSHGGVFERPCGTRRLCVRKRGFLQSAPCAGTTSGIPLDQ